MISTIFTLNNKFNGRGLLKYWKSVNDSFEAWDREQMKNNRSMAAATKPGKSTQAQKSVNNQQLIVGTGTHQRRFPDYSAREKFKWNPNNARFKLPKYNKY